MTWGGPSCPTWRGNAPRLPEGDQMAKKAAKKAAKKTAGRGTTKSARGAGGRKAAKGARKGTGRKPNAAFMAPVTPDDTLAAVVGAKPLPRTELTKRLWAYIKKNKLQDAKNKRMIKSDATLKAVFANKSTVNMFEMTKLVSKHLK
jgi:chromatin remodeling complex protein RSC6